MSPAQVIWHTYQAADDRIEALHDAAVAARAAQTDKDGWTEFLKGLGY